MTLKIKLLLTALLVALLVAGWLEITRQRSANAALTTEAEYLKTRLSETQIEARALAGQLESQRLALSAREAEKARLADEKDRLAAELETLYEQDREAGAWADGLLPNGVLDRLRGG